MTEVELITKLCPENRRELYQSLGMLQGLLDIGDRASCEEGLILIDEIIELIAFNTERKAEVKT